MVAVISVHPIHQWKVEQFDDRRFKFRAVETVRSVREVRSHLVT
jgi:hypothetical protein